MKINEAMKLVEEAVIVYIDDREGDSDREEEAAELKEAVKTVKEVLAL